MNNQELTEYEVATSIRSSILLIASEVMNYRKQWSNEYSLSRIDEIANRIKSAKWFRSIDPYQMNQEQLFDLGFRRWSEDNQLMLAPLWLFEFLRNDIKYIDINSEEIVLDRLETDNDHRYGCLSFGIIPEL